MQRFIINLDVHFNITAGFLGQFSRQQAKNLLSQPVNCIGSFLIRSSTTYPGNYSLSLKCTKNVHHFKIMKLESGRWCICNRVSFLTIPELVAYYQNQDPENGLPVNLKAPCVIAEEPLTAGLSKETNEAWEIDRKSMHLAKKLGRGRFSEVWKGVWNGTTEVAVKTIKPGAIYVNAFLKEAALMKKLRHPKVIQLYAVCTQEEPIYMITELMKHGSLLKYLRGDGRSLKLPQQIDIGAQVAAGMAYLEMRDYVHRELGARNILVSENLICKVADFGLARVINEDIYEAHTGAKFAIRWTSPEAAMYSRFTFKSDVWSFGIMLYELITYGCLPYSGLNNAQALEAIVNGFRMPCPANCPELLYEIMKDCWRDDPASRPTFETLQWRMEDFFLTDTGPLHIDPATLQ